MLKMDDGGTARVWPPNQYAVGAGVAYNTKDQNENIMDEERTPSAID